MNKFLLKVKNIFVKKEEKVGLFGVHGFMENGEISFKSIKPMLIEMKKDFYFTDLHGHGDNEDINDFNHEKLLDRVEKEYIAFKSKYNKVILIGYSMGGAIAAHLASKYGAHKLVLVSAALKYGGTKRLTSQALNIVKKALSKDISETKTAAEFLEQNINMSKNEIQKLANDLMQSYNVNRSKNSHEDRLVKAKVGVFIEFTRLIAKIRSNIGWIDMPVRIYQSTDDELVPIDSAYYALELCTNPDRKVIILNKTRHGIMNSSLKEYVLKEIIEFFYGGA
jgi:carboxylesterase